MTRWWLSLGGDCMGRGEGDCLNILGPTHLKNVFYHLSRMHEIAFKIRSEQSHQIFATIEDTEFTEKSLLFRATVPEMQILERS